MHIDVLNKGYVELVDSWGSDEGIIEAARMSTNKGFQGWEAEYGYNCSSCIYRLVNSFKLLTDELNCPACGASLVPNEEATHKGDTKLLHYLYEHKHLSPFEMCGLTVEVQAPIFVFREWHRHRTQSYNEMSARYTPLPDFNYLPTEERLFVTSKENKQAGTIKGANELTLEEAQEWRAEVERFYAHAECLYQNGLKAGIPKELARIVLPVGRYSRMRASANLRNWLGFLALRLDESAQWEIRQYAKAVGYMVKERFPKTYDLFEGE